MKYAIFLLALLSCKKNVQNIPLPLEQSFRNGSSTFGWFYTGAVFPSQLAHDVKGFSAVADYKRLRLSQATMRTYWLGVYYTANTGCRKWLQFGYINDVFGQRLFLDGFDQGSCGNGENPPPTTFLQGFVYPSLGSRIEFKIAYRDSTIFTISIGGHNWADVDLKCNTIADGANYLQIMTESQDNMSFPDQINTSQCSVFKNGSWSLIDTAIVQTATWPIEGHLQNSKLLIGEFNMGGSKGTIYPTPTQLW